MKDVSFEELIFKKVMAPVFKNSLYWVSPYHYFSSVLMTTQFHQLPIECSPTEFSTFPPPPNHTCASYMKLFFEAGGPGYIMEGNGTCSFCPFTNGDEFLDYQLSWSFDTRWRDLSLLTVLLVLNWFAMCLWMWKRTR
jgi:ATP-binding cassette subfamily G (WHITE) protein 2 (SNQ2)